MKLFRGKKIDREIKGLFALISSAYIPGYLHIIYCTYPKYVISRMKIREQIRRFKKRSSKQNNLPLFDI